jgi:CrcB protein
MSLINTAVSVVAMTDLVGVLPVVIQAANAASQPSAGVPRAGIIFCSSLTTFSSWMLQLSTTLKGGNLGGSLVVLLSTLIGGLILMSTSFTLMLRWLAGRKARP